MELYSLEAVEKLQNSYLSQGGEVVTLQEGTLLDDYMLFGHGLKTVIIQAVFLNEWSSAYKVRRYNKVPKKYASFIG